MASKSLTQPAVSSREKIVADNTVEGCDDGEFMPGTGLVHYDRMRHELALCSNTDEVLEIRQRARAAEIYAQQINDTDAERQIVAIRLRAERKLGQLLKEMKQSGERDSGSGGDRKSQSPATTVKQKTLSDIGITRDQSSKFQQLADVPEKAFEDALADTRSLPSTDGVIKQTHTNKSGTDAASPAVLEIHAASLDAEQTAAEADDADPDDVEFYSYDRDCPKGKGEYTVTLTVAASRLKTIQKEAEQAFGEMLLEVEKDEPCTSRAGRLAVAEEQVVSAKDMVEELRDELQSWRDNLPENFQSGSKADELDEAISNLQGLEDSLDASNFNFDIEIPGMF
jgi:hypothetical protein